MDIFQNFASGILSADPGTGGTLASGNFAFLPAVAAPFTLRLAVDPDGVAGTPEIVIVTAHTAFATSVTATRGQETAYGAGPARAHAVDTVWRHVLTRASLIELMEPGGRISATVGATADPGCALIDGSTVVNAQVLYPVTWSRIPATWKAAPDMVMPDWRGKTLFMDDAGAAFTLGAAGGSNTHNITQAELPAATITINPPPLTIDPPNTVITIDPPNTVITIDPPNTAVTIGDPAPVPLHYRNGIGADSGTFGIVGLGGSVGPQSGIPAGDMQFGTGTELFVDVAGVSGSVDIAPFAANVDIAPFAANVDIAPFAVDAAPFASGNLGSGVAMDLRPAHGTVNFQIRLG